MTGAPGYEKLMDVLARAFNDAAFGKGKNRHAQGHPFHEQPMQKLCQLYGVGFALGQAGKKMQESQRMQTDAAVRELLGAINYIAGAIIYLEAQAGANVTAADKAGDLSAATNLASLPANDNLADYLSSIANNNSEALKNVILE